jgi:hypothetical protein
MNISGFGSFNLPVSIGAGGTNANTASQQPQQNFIPESAPKQAEQNKSAINTAFSASPVSNDLLLAAQILQNKDNNNFFISKAITAYSNAANYKPDDEAASSPSINSITI